MRLLQYRSFFLWYCMLWNRNIGLYWGLNGVPSFIPNVLFIITISHRVCVSKSSVESEIVHSISLNWTIFVGLNVIQLLFVTLSSPSSATVCFHLAQVHHSFNLLTQYWYNVVLKTFCEGFQKTVADDQYPFAMDKQNSKLSCAYGDSSKTRHRNYPTSTISSFRVVIADE